MRRGCKVQRVRTAWDRICFDQRARRLNDQKGSRSALAGRYLVTKRDDEVESLAEAKRVVQGPELLDEDEAGSAQLFNLSV